VFDHIEVLTKSKRKWTVLGCDALPYTIGNKVIDNHMVCPECYMEFEDITDFEEHRNYRGHCEDIPLKKCRKYNNILLLPGQGHYEINMVKALFKLLWDIGLIDLAKMLGFSSRPVKVLPITTKVGRYYSFYVCHGSGAAEELL
ncbi:Hypothetical predicted protein, partial [Mytilus galloprovincialis]